MTYNDKLEEILSTHLHEIKAGHDDKLLQALTTLFKEMIAEAKPEQQTIYGSEARDHVSEAYNLATKHFEQNLIKLLEEK